MAEQETIIGQDVEYAAALLHAVNLAPIPSETAHGLAGNMFSETAIQQVCELKKRPDSILPFVHIARRNQLEETVNSMPPAAGILPNSFSLGPLTILLVKKSNPQGCITSGYRMLAISIFGHRMGTEFVKEAKLTLVAPGANPSAYLGATKVVTVILSRCIPCVLDGGPWDRRHRSDDQWVS